KKQRTRKSHPQQQPEKNPSPKPQQFPPALIRTVDKRLGHVQQHDNDDGTRTIGVNAAQESATSYFLGDVGDGGMCVISRRHVIERKKNSGDHRRHEKKEQPRSKYVSDSGTTRNRLIQRRVQQRVEAGTAVEPLKNTSTPLPRRCALGFVGRRRILRFHALLSLQPIT